MRQWFIVCCACLAGCAALSIEPKVTPRPPPDAFAGAAQDASSQPTGAPSIAAMSWRAYFADPTLEALVSDALTGNLDLAAALERIEITRASVTRATGALLPQVALSLGAGIRRFGLYTMDGAGNATTDILPGQRVPEHLPDLQLGLQTSWEVDIWGKLRNQRRAARAEYLASVEGTNFVITSLVADIAVGYYALLALDHASELVGKAIERQERALEVVRMQKEVGRGSELGVKQLEAQVANTRASRIAIAQERVVTENRLNVLLGRYPVPIKRDKAALFADLPAELHAGVPADLLQNRADIRQVEQQMEAAQFDVHAARAAFFPNLNITAGIGLQAFSPAVLFPLPQSLAYSVGGGLIAPLFNWTGLLAQLRGAKATQAQAVYMYQKVLVTAVSEVSNGLADVQNSARILELRKIQQSALEEAIETADALFAAGQASYLEVLLAQQNALRTDLELIDAWKLQRIATVQVYKALGGGWR